MVKVQHTMHTTFLRLFFLTVVISITNAVEDRLKRQEFLLPPLEMRLQENIPGNPVLDYPIFDEVPDSSFRCSSHQHAGYYADMEARCQVFHICQFSGRQDSFLCPNGTVFDQRYFVCNWWFNVDCNLSPTFYSLNSQLFTSSDSPLVTQEFISQDVAFNPPESLPVPGVVGGGSVIPSPNNNFREPHSLDNFDAPSKDWQLASTTGSVSSWSRPSNQNSNQRPVSPAVRENYPGEFEPVSAPAPTPLNYPSEEQDFDYPPTQQSPQLDTVPITTYRPRVPYVPPKIRVVSVANIQTSTETYQESEDFPPEETLPRQPPTYYTPRVPERQRPAASQPPVTQNYPGEDEFISEETFPEDTSSYTQNVISDTQRPVPLSPEEELSLSSDYPTESVSFDYDTFTTSPEPSPLEADFNYGQRLNPSTTDTPAPVQITSPRVKIHKQKRPKVSAYPVEEDLPFEEMLPITESVRFSQPEVSQTPRHHSTPSYYPSERPTRPQPDPVPDPQIAPEIDYRSPQTLQFVSGKIPIISQNKQRNQNGNVQYGSTVLPEVQQQQQQQQNSQFFSSQSPMQTFNQDLEFAPLPQTTHRVPQFMSSTSPPIDQQMDFRSPQNTQRVPQFMSSTPSPIDQQIDFRSLQNTQRVPQFMSSTPSPIDQQIDFRSPQNTQRVPQFMSSTPPPIDQQIDFRSPQNNQGVPQFHSGTSPAPMLDHQNTQTMQFISTPISIVPDFSTEFSNVSIDSMPHNAISIGQSYLPEILDVQSEIPIGGSSADIQQQQQDDNNLYEYRFPEQAIPKPIPEQPPIKTVQTYPTEEPFESNVNNIQNRPNFMHTSSYAPTPSPQIFQPRVVQQNQRPSYPTKYTSVNDPISAPDQMPQFNQQQTNNKKPSYPSDEEESLPTQLSTPSSTPAYSLPNALSGLKVQNQNNQQNGDNNNNFSNQFGPLEILTVDKRPVLQSTEPITATHNPTYVSIRPSYPSSNSNQGQLEDLVVSTPPQNLLAPFPQRGSINNNNYNQLNQLNQQIPSRVPHFNNNNNNNNNIQNQFPHQNNNNNFRPAQFPHQNNNNNYNNNNNFNNNFRPQNQIIFPRHNNNNNNNINNNFGRNADIQDKHNSIGALNGVNNRGPHLTQGQNQNGNFISPHKSIPNNGFLTNPRNTKPVSVPLISLPLFKSNDREWAIQKLSQQIFSDVDRVQSMANVRSLTVPAGSRPVVIRLASDPRIPPKIEINRRIHNGNRNRNGKEKKQLRKRPIKRRTHFS